MILNLKRKNNEIYNAFSLVEIMVGLVVMSCVITAFAPMITKKVSTTGATINAGGGVGALKDECDDIINSDCNLCFKNTCIMCDKTCTSDQFKDTANCQCLVCRDTYGTSCLSCYFCIRAFLKKALFLGYCEPLRARQSLD